MALGGTDSICDWQRSPKRTFFFAAYFSSEKLVCIIRLDSRRGKRNFKIATLVLEGLLGLNQSLNIDFYIISTFFFCESSFRRISGITNRKQTSKKTVDIVPAVSSSLRIRMDLTRQTPRLVGFFLSVVAGYSPIDLISIN